MMKDSNGRHGIKQGRLQDKPKRQRVFRHHVISTAGIALFSFFFSKNWEVIFERESCTFRHVQ